MKKKTKVIAFVSALVLFQLYLMGSKGSVFGVHLIKNSSSNKTNGGVSDKRVIKKGNIKMDNYQPKQVDGSYVRYIVPLDTSLRPYYRIATVVHIYNDGQNVDQQFLVYPIKKKIPQKYQNKLKSSKLQAMSKEFNVRGKLIKYLSKNIKGRRVVTFDKLNYNSKYNNKNETDHYDTAAPFVIAPYEGKTGNNSEMQFTANGLKSNDHSYTRITTAQAKKLFNKSDHVPLSWDNY